MSRRSRWIVAPLAAVAAALIVLVVLFDWNWLKGPLEDQVSAALDREFEIAGDLDVDLSTAPVVTLEQIQIANADWGSRSDVLTVERVTFAIDLWRLLDGEIVLPFARAEKPDLLLETNRDGEANWQFGEQDAPTAAPTVPIIRSFEVAATTIRYHRPDGPDDVVAALEMVSGAISDGSTGVRMNVEGTVEQRPLSLSLIGASLDRLDAPANRYPFQLDGRIGTTRLALVGSAEQPLQADGLSVEVVLESEEPATLLALAGLEGGAVAPLEVELTLTGQNKVWSLHQIEAHLGGTDLSGSLSFDSRGGEPAIAAEFHSNQVRIEDVRDVIGLVQGAGSSATDREASVDTALATAKEKLDEPDSGLGLSRAMLPPIDAEVSFTVDRLSGPEVMLEEVALYGRLRDRLPRISLNADGRYKGEAITLDVEVGNGNGGEIYPIRIDVAAAGTRAHAEGGLTEPAELNGLQLRFDVASRNLDQLPALGDIAAPQIPPFEITGQLAQHGSSWQLTELDGRLGQSDLRGHVAVAFDRPEPLITADLASDQVRLEDLQPLVPHDADRGGADPDAAVDAALSEAKSALANEGQAADGGQGFRLDRDVLPGVDAEISYAVGSFVGPDFALADLDLQGRFKDGLPRLALTGGGEYRSRPVELDVQVGPAEQPASEETAYPVDASLKAGTTEIEVAGKIGKPETLDGLDLKFRAASQDINSVLALFEISLPQIPTFSISGHVIQDGQVWRVADLSGQVRESELQATVEIDLSERRPFITADLRSDRLLVSDLMKAGDKAAAIEERIDEESQKEAKNDGPPVISAEGVNFDALPAIDADISFEGQVVDAAEFSFDQLSFDLKLRDQAAILDASGDGQFRDEPLVFEAHAGTEAYLENSDVRYPIDLRIETERTLVAIDGTVARPGRAAGLDVDVTLAGPNLDRLGELLQLSLPTTPPFELQSHLSHDEKRWSLTGLGGTIGDSDIQGRANLVLGGERPTLEAELTSDRLDFDDLGLLVGAPADPEETVSVEQARAAAEEAATRGVLPDEPFDVLELRAMDARVSYRAKQVQASKLPLEGVALDLTLEDGQLTLEPLRFDLADGALDSVIRLDGRTDVLAGDFELEVRQIRLSQLLSEFDIDIAEVELEKGGVGTFGGRADLEVRGNSIQELAGSADGEVALIMGGGRINALIVEGIGLDVGEAITLLLFGDEEQQSEMVPIQCLVARFDVQKGVMRTEALVLETSDSTITGKGRIDLGKETLALELLAHPKDTSVLSASTPVRIEGTFENPQIDLISEELQEMSLQALALGVVMPVIGALFPFFEEGETERTNCARLIADASAAAPAPVSDQAE